MTYCPKVKTKLEELEKEKDSCRDLLENYKETGEKEVLQKLKEKKNC